MAKQIDKAMARHFRSYIAALALLLILIAGVYPVFAQNAFALRINAVEVVEDTDALILNSYFTVYDSVSGSVITNARINSAEIVFVDSQTKTEAALLQPDTPFYIALVLDTSGSMAGAAAALRNAAIEAIQSPPAGARFAVMTFNEQFDVLQEFLDIRNTDPLERAISKVQPVPGAGTCLYDAAYSAIVELERAPRGRRAVVLFTDGKDELPNGVQCSRYSYEDVIQYATRGDISVPVHTIGLAGQSNAINANELRNMALTTGGFSVIGTQEDLSELFQSIMEGLKSQWLAQAELYPTTGTYEVLLRVRLDDGSVLSQPLSFTASRNYAAPPPPFDMSLDGLSYNSAQTSYQVDLSITSPQRVQSLGISVWDKSSGLKVLESQHQNLSPSSSFFLPADQMINGSEYEIRFMAYGVDNQVIPNARNEKVYLVHEFRHEVGSAITIDTITIDGEEMVASLRVQTMQEIGMFQAWLVNEETNVQVPGSEYSVDTLENGMLMRIPMKRIPAGKYSLVVRALDRGGKPGATTTYEGINYTPPSAFGFFKTVTTILVQNMLALFAMLLILLLVGGWLVIRYRPTTAGQALQALLPQRKASNAVSAPTEVIAVSPGPAKNIARQPTLSVPVATLRILESSDMAWMGKTCKLGRYPFTIGRDSCDLTIENDLSMSHHHATITYDEQQQVFLITDVSRNGVLLGGQRIAKDTPTKLSPGTVIGIGPRTTAIFDVIKG